ncbi:MAG: hypothetical protein IPP57_23650 [Candidatus Obscuribacter sp.]|nr:hypothetical protein [Candidatus Obscuribacter sp.]MBK7836632.1 hypothetical protein [Candidatus Obscuribacter sp.]MBK9204187.1 hypothetical protein [Candidatus Obscuribacter sp.]MBK9622594.1 hypothetical protein [Candidatus Obscuribacter sp.]MBK9773773.1 hypothetical protein [Candidatus Obscuribacter sp.]
MKVILWTLSLAVVTLASLSVLVDTDNDASATNAQLTYGGGKVSHNL